MPGKRAYLEAPDRTQDLLSIKWALRSAGYSIGSTWHDADTITWPPFKNRWDRNCFEQMQSCDCLIVICGAAGTVAPELTLMAGFASACGISLYWIGPRVPGLNHLETVHEFENAESFQKQLLSGMVSDQLERRSTRLREPIAA